MSAEEKWNMLKLVALSIGLCQNETKSALLLPPVETEFLMDHRKRRHKKLIAEEATWLGF